MTTPYPHGGDVERAARQAGVASDCILDFSSNINPMGLPAGAAERLAREARDPRMWNRYPDPQYGELRRAISRYAGVAPESIVIASGADSLIHAAVRALAPDRCVIPIPAFSEYERACKAAGCESSPGPLRPGDLLILNNPHNPSGACASRDEMLEQIGAAAAAGAAVLADEAFIDYVPESAITQYASQTGGVISIRSLTKFFGCPGLRAGYAVAIPDTARVVGEQLPPWPVTTLAANALAEALQDADYPSAAREQNRQRRERFAAALSALGCDALPGAANFLLLRTPAGSNAVQIRDRLLREHAILVRECDSFAGLEPGRYLRVAVRRDDENQRLITALANILREIPCLPTHP